MHVCFHIRGNTHALIWPRTQWLPYQSAKVFFLIEFLLDDSRKFSSPNLSFRRFAKVSRYTAKHCKCDNWQLLINEAWMGLGWQEIDKTLDLCYIRVAGLHRECEPAVLFDPPNFRPRTMTHILSVSCLYLVCILSVSCLYLDYTYVQTVSWLYVQTVSWLYVQTVSWLHVEYMLQSIQSRLYIGCKASLVVSLWIQGYPVSCVRLKSNLVFEFKQNKYRMFGKMC